VTRRSRAASFGKRVATRVRRLISRLSRSRPLVVRIRLRWASGKLKTVSASGTLASSQAESLGACGSHLMLLLLAVFLVPWSETEIHKRKCQSAWSSLHGESTMRRLKVACYKIIGAAPPVWESNSDDRWQLSESRQALIEVGFLAQERLVLKNGAARAAEEAFYEKRQEDAFVWVDWHGRRPTILVVTAPRSEIVAVSNIVRSIDEKAK